MKTDPQSSKLILPHFTFLLSPGANQIRLANKIVFHASPLTWILPLRQNVKVTSCFYDLTAQDIEDKLRELQPDLLGRAALNHFKRFNEDTHILFHDCTNPDDILPFIHHYSAAACLCISIGTLKLTQPECRTIWLPQCETKRQLKLLTTALTILQAA